MQGTGCAVQLNDLLNRKTMKYPDIRIVLAGEWGKLPSEGPHRWIVLDAHGSRPVVCETLEQALTVVRKWTELWV